MKKGNSVISVIIPTYNRANTIKRAIDSVLAQTFKDFEIIVIDDGSTDDTINILNKYNDKRLKIIRHPQNKGVSAAINTGFNHINGEWFTLLGSDDEMVAEALETMIKIPQQIDDKINAITCNCVDTSTGEFSGKGIEKNGYLDNSTIIRKLSGEHWGLTKTNLLGHDRLNENLPGSEATLWYKINERAKRYYIHQGLRIYHTEGKDRLCKIHYDNKEQAKIYAELKKESQYLSILKRYNPNEFRELCLKGIVILTAVNDKNDAKYYYSMMEQGRSNIYYKIAAKMTILIGSWMAIGIIKFIGMLKLATNTIKTK